VAEEIADIGAAGPVRLAQGKAKKEAKEAYHAAVQSFLLADIPSKTR
jgi:hypothetical protein